MKASVFIGTSLDGFIARTNGAFDFLPAGGGEPHGYDEFMATVDALVIGRHTFDTVLAFEAWPYTKPVFVLSTRPLPATPPCAIEERMSGAPAAIVSQLAVRGVRHVYVDGGVSIQRFLEAGLIQRLGAAIRGGDLTVAALRPGMLRLAGRAHLTVTTQAIGETSDRISKYLLTIALLNIGFGSLVFLGFLWSWASDVAIRSET